MIRLLKLGVFLLLPSVLYAQIDTVSKYYADQISIEQLKYKIDVLSNDSLLGRASAEEGQKRAEKFIVSEFKKHDIPKGNRDSYLQYFNFYQTKINALQFRFKDSLINPENNIFNYDVNQNIDIEGDELIFCAFGIKTDSYNDYDKINVEGKLVFVIEGCPIDDNGASILSREEYKNWNSNRDLKEQTARDLGAKGIVFIQDDYSSFYKTTKQYLSHARMKLYQKQGNSLFVPTFYIDNELAYFLLNTSEKEILKYVEKSVKFKKRKSIESKGNFKLRIEVDLTLKETSNVLAAIKSDDPDADWLVLSAHYDHLGFDSLGVFNGADDNGSGTASVLELSRIFKAANDKGIKFKKNILFILVSGEEIGLLGSKYYIKNPVYPLDKTLVNLNIDMIGRVDKNHEGNSNYVYIIGADRISKKLHDINVEMNTTYSKLDLDYTYNDVSDPNRYYERSDHYNFAKEGVPVIFYFNGTHADYHRKGDTADKIDYEALLTRTKLIFHTAWELSQMEGGL